MPSRKLVVVEAFKGELLEFDNLLPLLKLEQEGLKYLGA